MHDLYNNATPLLMTLSPGIHTYIHDSVVSFTSGGEAHCPDTCRFSRTTVGNDDDYP